MLRIANLFRISANVHVYMLLCNFDRHERARALLFFLRPRTYNTPGPAPEVARITLWERIKIGKEHYLNLMLVVPFVITYICLGALVFSFLEDTSYLNALYVCFACAS